MRFASVFFYALFQLAAGEGLAFSEAFGDTLGLSDTTGLTFGDAMAGLVVSVEMFGLTLGEGAVLLQPISERESVKTTAIISVSFFIR